MANTPQFVPTAENTYVISYPIHGTDAAYDFAAILARSRTCERQGDVEQACNLRYEGVKKLMDLIPDEDEVQLDWEEEENQSVLELLKRSAIDHFLINDFEMSTAMLELLLELDPEDHLEAIILLAFNYLAMEEYELFDEVSNDISDKYACKEVLTMWAAFRRSGRIPEGDAIRFRTRFAPYFAEFTADEHPADGQYLEDIESERPSVQAQARELWLRTENLWTLFPDFIAALRR